MLDEGIVIVGTGQAAFQLAGFLRTEGYAGCLRMIGEERHLPYQRPPLSKAFMSGECSAAGLTFQAHEYYVKHGIELTLGCTVKRIDRVGSHVETAAGERIPYTNLVLATGARNRRLAQVGQNIPGVLDLRSLDDAASLRDRLAHAREVVVVGAGFLGLEFAAVAVDKGVNVTVIEASPALMGRAVSESIGDCFRSHHESLGVRFLLGTTVSDVAARAEGGCRVQTSSGQLLEADLVVISVGVQPNVELAESAGLRTDNGIVVNSYLQTEDVAISAIGDCAAFESRFAEGHCRIESVQNAIDQARCLAKTLTGAPTTYNAVPWFWSDQGGRKLQIAGLTRGADGFILRGDPRAEAFSVYCFRRGTLVGVESVNRPTDHMEARRLLHASAPVTPSQVADQEFDLKALLPKPA